MVAARGISGEKVEVRLAWGVEVRNRSRELLEKPPVVGLLLFLGG